MISRPSLDESGLRGTLAALQAATASADRATRLQMQGQENLLNQVNALGQTFQRYGENAMDLVGRTKLQDREFSNREALNEKINQDILNRKSVYETGWTPDEIHALAKQENLRSSEVAQNLALQKRFAEQVNVLKAQGKSPETYSFRERPKQPAPYSPEPAMAAPQESAARQLDPLNFMPDDEYLQKLDAHQDALRQRQFLEENFEWGLSEADRQKSVEIANSMSKVRNDPRLTEGQKQQALDYWDGEMTRIHGVRLPKPKAPPTLLEQLKAGDLVDLGEFSPGQKGTLLIREPDGKSNRVVSPSKDAADQAPQARLPFDLMDDNDLREWLKVAKEFSPEETDPEVLRRAAKLLRDGPPPQATQPAGGPGAQAAPITSMSGIANALAGGVPPERIVAELAANGIDQQRAVVAVQRVIQTLSRAGPGGGQTAGAPPTERPPIPMWAGGIPLTAASRPTGGQPTGPASQPATQPAQDTGPITLQTLSRPEGVMRLVQEYPQVAGELVTALADGKAPSRGAFEKMLGIAGTNEQQRAAIAQAVGQVLDSAGPLPMPADASGETDKSKLQVGRLYQFVHHGKEGRSRPVLARYLGATKGFREVGQ